MIGISFAISGLVLFAIGLKFFLGSVKEAREDGSSQWPDNFLNVWMLGFGLAVFLAGACLWTNVDLRLFGAWTILIGIIIGLALISLAIYAFYLAREKVHPKIKSWFDRKKDINKARKLEDERLLRIYYSEQQEAQRRPVQMAGINAPVPDPAIPIDGPAVPKIILAPRRPTRKSPAKKGSSTVKQPAKKPVTKKSPPSSTK